MPVSSPWWDQASLQIQHDALRLRKAGDFRAAAALYQRGYQEAVRRGDGLAQARYLMSAGGSEMFALEYRAALATFLQARDLASGLEDHADLGGIDVNLSSLYLQMWDLPAATRAAEEGLREAGLVEARAAYFKPPLLMQMGRIHALLADGEAHGFFAAGIEAARARDDLAIEALSWDLLGEEQLGSAHLAEAEAAFLEAFRLRRFFLAGELGLSYGRLGALALARGDFRTAERLTQWALDAAGRGAPAEAEYVLLHQRGLVRRARGEDDAALRDFSLALDAAARWRLEVLPAQSTLTSTNIGLEQEIFHSFIQLAAEQAFRYGNAVWASKAWEAVELNRASSLRQSLELAGVWREKLPLKYWETLAQLGARGAAGPGQNRLLSRLTEMEAQAGAGIEAKKVENIHSRNSLNHFQEGLRDSELLLSFELGKKESYLWAVSRGSLRLYRLAAEQEIAKAVENFREAFPAGGAEAAERGRELYRQLFGQLSPLEAGKPAWLLSLDGALFDIPFAALVTEQRGGNTEYLVERHSLQTVPGALLLSASAGPEIQGGQGS
ncbi:MAG: CHAT domain-containing protein, partial [Acidobacteriota bacterium]|nr:CHAT domain-containing protein [Acidobacteriota bacterium]